MSEACSMCGSDRLFQCKNTTNLPVFIYDAIFFQLNDRKEREIEEAREEIKKIQEQSQEAVQRMRAERDTKIRECEEIRAQVSLQPCM